MPLSNDFPRIAIVGGGISGLAAAYRVRALAPRSAVTVWEASGRLGGALDTRQFAGFPWENGADSFTTKLPWGVELCTSLGIADELMATSKTHRRALVVCRGRLEPVPAGFVLMRPQKLAGILWSRVLSPAGKIRLLAEPFIRRHPDADAANHDESVASFARRRLGNEVFERLVQPLLGGIYVADAEKLSLGATMPEFLEAERRYGSLWRAPREGLAPAPEGSPHTRSRDASVGQAAAAMDLVDAQAQESLNSQGARYHSFVTPRQGIERLIQSLARTFASDQIRLNARVTGLQQVADGRWRLSFDDSAVPLVDEEATFDGVIVATPAPCAGQLFERAAPDLAGQLKKIAYASSVVVNLGYHPTQLTQRPDGFGFVAPEIENMTIVAASFPSVKFAHRGNDDWFPIRVFLGGAKRPECIEWEDERLINAARRDLEAILPLEGAPRFSAVVRWPNSMPQYHVGHVALVGAIREAVGRLSGVELAGNAYDGVGIPQCIRSGSQAAERLCDALTKR